MIEAVQDRINRNARGILTAQEIEAFEAPVAVNEYEAKTRDDGLVVATRTQHRLGEDGSGGGFKIVEAAPEMSLAEMKRLSRVQSLGLGTLMTLKGDLIQLDLPEGYGNDFGGAKGVMFVPKGSLSSRDEMDHIEEDYTITQARKGKIGIGTDRHAPDMNTGESDMDRMAKTLVEYTGDLRSQAAFSGKSVEAGGLEGREIATALGLVFTLSNQLQALGMNPRETTVAVQGSGNVGYHFARLVSDMLDVKVIGMSDRYRAVVSDKNKPLRMDETITFDNRLISGWNEELHGQLANPDDLLGMGVDVLVFAAAPDAVTKEKNNKEQVKAKVVLQGANNPMDAEAIDYLIANGKTVIADILGNMGGFAASNFEYNQGMTGKHWTEAMVINALKRVMDDAYLRVYQEADNVHNMVDPAFRVALKRRYERDHSGLYTPVA